MDDITKRNEFRKKLSRKGFDEVRYLVDTGKVQGEKAVVARQWLEDFEAGKTIKDDLRVLVDEFDALRELFVEGDSISGYFLPTAESAKFEQLFLETKSLIDDALGRNNDYSKRLLTSHVNGVGGFMGGPSLACVEEIIAFINAAIKHIGRKPRNGLMDRETQSNPVPFVDPGRIDELRNISSNAWDFSRLAQMCVEINAAYLGKNYISVAALTRAIIDHVPPVFGKHDFEQVASNHGGQSFKASMKQLQNSMRNIADAYLHQHIRKKENVPNPSTVEVRKEIDVLLAEIIRISS